MTDRASAEGLHETHVCRDCGANITIPYVRASALAEAIHDARFTSKRPHTDREFAEAILARLSTPRTETSDD